MGLFKYSGIVNIQKKSDWQGANKIVQHGAYYTNFKIQL